MSEHKNEYTEAELAEKERKRAIIAAAIERARQKAAKE